MKEISIERFKSAFQIIAELVVSLDNDHKAILKSRKEIDIYLESQIPEWQEMIIQELNHVLYLNAISESYLLADQKEYGTKISFENYLNFKLRSITSQIEYNQFLNDDGIIQNLKEKLKGFSGKDAKINFLLEKKRDLEGDYPEALGKILTKNEIYLFLNREIGYWEKYREISIKCETNIPQQLKTNLTGTQRGLLFDLLVKGRFILDENKDCFIWAFGKPDEEQPENFQPIKWEKSKEAFAELLTVKEYSEYLDGKRTTKPLIPIIETLSNQNKRDIEKLFVKNEKPLDNLKTPKKDSYSGDYANICNIINQIQI